MTTVHNVADIRAKAQLDPEDRRAIKQSIYMTLLGIAAVAVAALCAPAEKTSMATRVDASESTSVVSPAAAAEPTQPVGSAFHPDFVTPPGEKIETSLR